MGGITATIQQAAITVSIQQTAITVPIQQTAITVPIQQSVVTATISQATISVTMGTAVSRLTYINAGEKFRLDGITGDSYFIYNETTNKVELFVDNVKKGAWG